MIDPSLLTANDFIGVRAALVAELGNDAASALVLTRIFYRADERWREAIEREGEWWWRVTYDGIADETGLTKQQVRRACTKLIESGHVAAEKHHVQGINDQTLSYRVRLFESTADVVDSTHRDVVDPALLPITKTVEDGDIARARQREAELSDGFVRFYALWPRHVGRREAERAFRAAAKRVGITTILDAALAYRKWSEEVKQDPQFIPYPASWLNRDGWHDELVWPQQRPAVQPAGPRRLTAAEQNLADFQAMHMAEAQDKMTSAAALGWRVPAPHSAIVDMRPPVDPEYPRNQVFIRCPECESEWAWMDDSAGAMETLKSMAAIHNANPYGES
jgi:hypothetical protein